MKYSFHVSTMDKFWEEGLQHKYIAEPYLAKVYNLTPSNEIIIAEYTRKNSLDYQKDVDYLNEKIVQYRSILIKNLNKLHGTEYSTAFWTKALGLGFTRFVHMLYDGYKIASQYNPEQHIVKILDKKSYIQFQDFEEFRELFQHTAFGYEQMFSLYMNTFHHEIYENNCISAGLEKTEKISSMGKVRKIFLRLKNFTWKKLYYKILRFLWRKKPVIGIFNSFFSYENMEILFIKSKGKISIVEFDYKHRIDNNIDKICRKELSKGFLTEDKFDEFFANALFYFFPTLYIESFQETRLYFEEERLKNTDLKYLISEAWIGDSRMSFFIAFLQEHGISHIYNEHNFLQQFLKGNHIHQSINMCDIYYTLGWTDKKYDNIKKGASLFPFLLKNKNVKEKKIDYLHIASFPFVKMPEINCAYGEAEENAPRYFKFLTNFFANLNKEVLEKLTFRNYPNSFNGLRYELDKELEIYLNKMENIDKCEISSKEQMLNSRLIIIDYLSTAYLEALIMNIPTIILFDSSRYYLQDRYESFFDELINVEIVQTNPQEAAKFINKMGDDIEIWWEKKEVQNARKSFLNDNIGDPEDAINFYLGLLKK